MKRFPLVIFKNIPFPYPVTTVYSGDLGQVLNRGNEVVSIIETHDCVNKKAFRALHISSMV